MRRCETRKLPMAWMKNIKTEWLNAARRTRSSSNRKAAGGSPSARPQPPSVCIYGDSEQSDFRDALATFRTDALVETNSSKASELIVVAQSRPDTVSHADFQVLQREAPLAGIVSLLGSWCEGETRTGKPWKGSHRVFWY